MHERNTVICVDETVVTIRFRKTDPLSNLFHHPSIDFSIVFSQYLSNTFMLNLQFIRTQVVSSTPARSSCRQNLFKPLLASAIYVSSCFGILLSVGYYKLTRIAYHPYSKWKRWVGYELDYIVKPFWDLSTVEFISLHFFVKASRGFCGHIEPANQKPPSFPFVLNISMS